jgi:hypothetical protein
MEMGEMSAENLMDKLSEAVSASAGDGLSFGEAAAVTLQLGLKLTIRHLGEAATAIVLTRIVGGLEGPEPPKLPDLIGMKPKGST